MKLKKYLQGTLLGILVVVATSIATTYVAAEEEIAQTSVAEDGVQLRQAILDASPGETVYVVDMTLTNELHFSGVSEIDVIIASETGAPVTINLSAGNAAPAFAFNFAGIHDVTLAFDNVVIDGNEVGRAIRFSPGPSPHAGVITLENAEIINTRSPINGAAVHVDHGSIVIENSRFENNITTANGGAVFVRCGNATISDSYFIGNESNFNGGALFVGAFAAGINQPGMGYVQITNSTFTDNTATVGNGGAINAHRDILITNSVVSDNTAFIGGGLATGANDSVITFTGGELTRNQATVAHTNDEIQEMADLFGMTFEEISAIFAGGGGAYAAGLIHFSDGAIVTHNTSNRNAGGIWVSSPERHTWTSNVVYSMNRPLQVFYEGDSYFVELDTMGGIPMPGITEVLVNNTMPRPTNPTHPNPNYIFVGWYTEAEYINLWDFADIVTSDMTLYARWELPTNYQLEGNEDDELKLNDLPATGSSLMFTSLLLMLFAIVAISAKKNFFKSIN